MTTDSFPYPPNLYPGCPCFACDSQTWPNSASGFSWMSRMSLCPTCGNKRCPAASDHSKYECTGSNEPGQEGSMYPSVPNNDKFRKFMDDYHNK